jgi:alkylation response protein AidB-like acyl-CoA dehydrogenase
MSQTDVEADAQTDGQDLEVVGDDTPEEARLRHEIRGWLEQHAAEYGLAVSHVQFHDTKDYTDACRVWQARLDQGGWGAPTWPVDHGGRGLSGTGARIIAEEQARWAVPIGAFAVGVAMVGPTLLTHGTPVQQQRLLAPLRRGEHVWCQLFSEPDAGSDLASLRTRAVRDGDEWVVTGQKVWTSGARNADWGILLARTEPGSWRHQGITYFVVDMRTPGIEVRPLVQINRNAHFNEVHLDEVRIPGDQVIGEVGEGWTVARTTLSAERVMIGSITLADRVESLIEAARTSGRTDEPVLRQLLAQAWTRSSILRWLGDRALAGARRGGRPGAEASVIKLGVSTFMAELGDLAMTVLGPEGMLTGIGDDDEHAYGPLQDQFLGQWASRIGGGTEQIQRNLIGEAVLGLPREPRPTQPDLPQPKLN